MIRSRGFIWKQLSLPTLISGTNWKGDEVLSVCYFLLISLPLNFNECWKGSISCDLYSSGNIQFGFLHEGMIADKIYCSRLLIVSGSGKNVGKTTLISSIIKSMKGINSIVAIKISPHFHPVSYAENLYHQPGEFTIYEENSFIPENDSSKMKLAGAYRTFYIQVKDTYVGEAFLKCLDYIEEDLPVICESGALNQVISPGLWIYVTKEDIGGTTPRLNQNMAIVRRDEQQFKMVARQIFYQSGKWEYQIQQT